MNRRTFLKLAAASAAGAALPSPSRAWAQDRTRKTKRVVLVAFAGGVRSRETILAPENVPNLARIASAGVLLPKIAVKPVGHQAATLALFTGKVEERVGKDLERGESPTVFEYLRKQRGLGAKEAWLACSSLEAQASLAFSTDAEHGARFGASVVGGDGVFDGAWKPLVAKLGRPRADAPEDRTALAELRRALSTDVLEKRPKEEPAPTDPAARARIERVILDELEGTQATLTGPGAGDARAIRAARTILLAYRPTLLGVALSNADVAHGNASAYVEVVRRNDRELGALWDSIQSDPELARTTTLLVVPDVGRDRDANAQKGLDHGDGSKDHLEVAGWAAGPDFERGRIVRDEVRSTQVCATVCELLGVRAEKSAEKALPIFS